nr:hypothetical protein Iba_chr04aCG18170 [Ipomoea batatas]
MLAAATATTSTAMAPELRNSKPINHQYVLDERPQMLSLLTQDREGETHIATRRLHRLPTTVAALPSSSKAGDDWKIIELRLVHGVSSCRLLCSPGNDFFDLRPGRYCYAEESEREARGHRHLLPNSRVVVASRRKEMKTHV